MSSISKIFFLLLTFNLINAQDCKSILEIETNKDSALIFINNDFYGYKKHRMEVELGKYFITIKENLNRWNEHEINDSVEIKLCEKEYLISFNLFDKLHMDSHPQNIAVYIYDSLMAFTPNFINVNQFHSVSLRKNGFEKKINSQDLKKYNVIPLDLEYERKSELFTESDWFKILVGSATIISGTAAYLKIKADKKYNEYLTNKNQKLLDEVNRLDLYSGIAFGLLQINFGYLIYKFLIE